MTEQTRERPALEELRLSIIGFSGTDEEIEYVKENVDGMCKRKGQ
jgi:hypothetical protein